MPTVILITENNRGAPLLQCHTCGFSGKRRVCGPLPHACVVGPHLRAVCQKEFRPICWLICWAGQRAWRIFLPLPICVCGPNCPALGFLGSKTLCRCFYLSMRRRGDINHPQAQTSAFTHYYDLGLLNLTLELNPRILRVKSSCFGLFPGGTIWKTGAAVTGTLGALESMPENFEGELVFN